MGINTTNNVQFRQNNSNPEQLQKMFDQMEAHFNQRGLDKSELTKLFANINANQSAFGSNGLKFGQDLAEYDASDVSRSNLTNINFFYNRNKVLETLTKGLGSSQNLNDFYNFIAYTQNIYKQATNKDDESPILKELVGAAKRGIQDLNTDPSIKLQLSNLLESNPQHAIFNPQIFEATRNELLKRSGLVAEVNGQSVQSDSFLGRAGQFGVGGAMTTGAAIGLGSTPVRWLADWKAGNSFSWGADVTKMVSGNSAFSRYMNTPGGLLNGFTSINHIPFANQLGWNAPNVRDFRNYVKNLANKSVAPNGIYKTFTLPNGITQNFATKKEYTEYLANGFKKDYANYLQHHAKEFVKTTKTSLTDDAAKAGVTGLKKLLPSGKILGAHLKTFGKYLPKRLAWVAAGLAAIGYGSTQLSKNPNTQESVGNLLDGTVNTAKSIGGGAFNMANDWFVPDLGVLYGDPWKQENQTQNILKGAYA